MNTPRTLLTLGAVLGLAWSGLAEAAAPVRPEKVSPRKIEKLEVVLGGEPALATLIPGRPVEVNVVVQVRKGKKLSTADGTLSTEELAILPTLGRYDPATRMFTPESDRSTVGEGSYKVKAVYGKGRQTVEAGRELRPDFAALLGPDPGDVAELSFTLGDGGDPRFLVPGRPAVLRATAVDRAGRRYTSGGMPNLPLFRLEVAADLAAWNPGLGQVQPIDDEARLGGKPYSVSVGYRGRPDLTVKHDYIPDFAVIRGLEPDHVKSLTVSVGGKREEDPIAPGSELQLVVSAQDGYGRTFSTASSSLPLPADRIEVAASNMDYDPSSLRLRAHPDCVRMADRSYEVQVSYRGRADLRETYIFSPDFLAPLQAYFLREDELAFANDAGKPGSDGQGGEPGQSGNMGAGQYGSGSTGGAGRPGRPGRPGLPGARGPQVRALAVPATTVDGQTRLVLMEIQSGREDRRYVLRSFEDPLLTLVSKGGTGGSGGAGGDGGDGGRGGGGYNTGDGGTGGDGGAGGLGGKGGPGGDIELILASNELKYQINAESMGGVGGSGGRGGMPGNGGQSGSAAAAVVTAVSALAVALAGGTIDSPPPAELGSMGSEGAPGQSGDPGGDGPPGEVNVRVSPDALTLTNRLPDVLKRCLILEDQGATYAPAGEEEEAREEEPEP